MPKQLTCAACGQPMKLAACGWVHVATGSESCDPLPEVRMDPEFIEHTIEVFNQTDTPMRNLRHAIVKMLQELKRLKSK